MTAPMIDLLNGRLSKISQASLVKPKSSKICLSCRRRPKNTYRNFCWEHQHSAQYNNVAYSTILHEWDDEERAGMPSLWSWPPPPQKYYPFSRRLSIPRRPTKPANRDEILAYGLKDVFVTSVTAAEWDVTCDRSEFRRLRDLAQAEDYGVAMQTLFS